MQILKIMNIKDVSYLGEVWKDIKNYEDEYEVSNLGRVRNKKTKKILKPCLDKKGYPMVKLYKNGKAKTKRVHQLVWEAFNGKIPEGYQINHISECKTENRLENLNLMTPKQNSNWGTRNERIGKANINNKNRSKSVIQKSLDGKVIRIWSSTIEIQRKLGYSQGNISACCRGGHYAKGKWINYTKAYGYIWQYTEEKAAS